MMNIYILNAVLLLFTALLGSTKRTTLAIETGNNTREIQQGFFIILVWTIVLWIENGFRGDFTTDYHNYYVRFATFRKLSLKETLEFHNVEKGFGIINFLIGHITDNFQNYLKITGLFAVSFFMIALWKLTDNKWPALLVFVGTGFFYGSFNLSSQFMAASVYALAVICIIEGKLWVYIALVLVAYSIQKSAIVMLPMYFILRHNFTKRYTRVIVAFLVILSLFFTFGAGSISRRLSVILYQDIYVNSTRTGYSLTYIIKCLSLVVITLFFTKLFDFDNLKDRMAYFGTIAYGAIILWSITFSMIQRLSYFFILFPMMAVCIIFERFDNKRLMTIGASLYFFLMQYGWFGSVYYFGS